MAPELQAELRSSALGWRPPSLSAVQRRLAELARAKGWRPPSRATLYQTLARLDGSRHEVAGLPAAVRGALYNLSPEGTIPGHQLAFYCFNYGSPAAASFAAGLPWLDLHLAARLRGWRPRSRGLVLAALAARKARTRG